MRDRVGIAGAIGLLAALACCSCGPGLEPPREVASRDPTENAGERPAAGDDDGLEERDAGPRSDDGLDAGVESDHTNGDDPAD